MALIKKAPVKVSVRVPVKPPQPVKPVKPVKPKK